LSLRFKTVLILLTSLSLRVKSLLILLHLAICNVKEWTTSPSAGDPSSAAVPRNSNSGITTPAAAPAPSREWASGELDMAGFRKQGCTAGAITDNKSQQSGCDTTMLYLPRCNTGLGSRCRFKFRHHAGEYRGFLRQCARVRKQHERARSNRHEPHVEALWVRGIFQRSFLLLRSSWVSPDLQPATQSPRQRRHSAGLQMDRGRDFRSKG